MANKHKNKELPQVLILRRTYIQRFPNGQQVALYHSEALDQFITVPLDGTQFSNTTESVIDQLKTISETNIVETVIFNNLSELNINKECADIILTFVEQNEELMESVCASDSSFLQLLEQAVQIATQEQESSEQKQELPEQ